MSFLFENVSRDDAKINTPGAKTEETPLFPHEHVLTAVAIPVILKAVTLTFFCYKKRE